MMFNVASLSFLLSSSMRSCFRLTCGDWLEHRFSHMNLFTIEFHPAAVIVRGSSSIRIVLLKAR
uniref:Uncharacterized protein n=1 Tax=Physcomitrium patens TaxID=3218 RepID=A0A2K1JD66_PHYPA|nr:hypothetical protein PHYPA_019752 [Physcomitrium patens]